jgi:hypothetical protein
MKNGFWRPRYSIVTRNPALPKGFAFLVKFELPEKIDQSSHCRG